ncbi:MAG TPA: hypothetical protein VIF14_07040 [Alphaproteobacteria bacterium]
MSEPGRRALAAAILANLAAGSVLGACDGQQQRSRRAGEGPGQKAAAPASGAAAIVVGTWRARLEDSAERSTSRDYTFTADGRVTVAPGRVCRYRVEAEALAVDCAGAARETAQGRLERRDADTLVWTIEGKAVRLERQPGVAEQQ